MIQSTKILQGANYIFGNNYLGFILGASWVAPILKIGSQRTIQPEQIPNLHQQDSTSFNFTKFAQIFDQQSQQNNNQPSGMILFLSIVYFYQKQVCVFIFLCFLTIAAQVYIPFFSRKAINYLDSNQNHSTKQNIIYLVEFIILYFMYMFLLSIYYYINKLKGVNLANILSLMIYRKLFRYPLLASKKIQSAEIINYSQMNCRKFQMLSLELKHLIIFAGQVIANFVFLYWNIGILSVILGALLMLIFCGIFFAIYQLMNNIGEELYKAKDKTVGMVQQILDIIKFIKTNSLQHQFLQKISQKREKQLKIKVKICLLNGLSKIFSSICSPTITIVIFLSHILLDNNLSSANAYFVIMIFANVQTQMNLLQFDISDLAQIIVAGKRIQQFLLAQQIDQKTIQFLEPSQMSQFAIEIHNGNFLWQKLMDQEQKQVDEQIERETQISQEKIPETQKVTINENEYIRIFKNLNIKFQAHQLTMIVGEIGSGKSSIIYSILNQMIPEPGKNTKINVFGSIAYCSQKPWIMTGNIRENIVFFHEYNQKKLDEAIYYSCMTIDLNFLKNGLDTEISERGTNLSGGQKARIGLARALYSNKDIYILDDVLSALDVNVSQFIINNTIKGYLKGKTIIMPTHTVNFLDRANQILSINKGQFRYLNQKQCLQYIGLKRLKNEQKAFQKKNTKIGNQNISQGQKISHNKDEQKNIIQQLLIPQEQLQGSTSLQTYQKYIQLNGGKCFVILLIILMLLYVTFSSLSNIQIQQLEVNQNKIKQTSYLYLYMGYSIHYSALLAIISFVFSFGLIKSGRKIHRSIMTSLVYASYINFHGRVPKGRILNRLSNDLEQMEDIPRLLQTSTIGFLTIIINFTLTAYATTPIVLIPIVIVIIISGFIYAYFVKSLFSVVRLCKISMSPLVSGVTDAINGVDTIRSYQLNQQFTNIQINKSDKYARMAYTQTSMFYWMIFRISFINIIFSSLIFGYCLFSGKKGAQLGLFLAFSMNFFHQLIELSYFLSQLLIKMVSTQRLLHLTDLQPEKGYIHHQKYNEYKKSQLSTEAIKFVNLSARYRQNLPFVLKNINLSIPARAKVGIVGRTGSGKTTLINCILNLVEHIEGSLYIQDKQIREYDLRELRSSITIIEQDPSLIKDTLRENLDPTHLYTDQQLYQVLRKCNFFQRFERRGGLNAQLSNNNLSQGEKQMVCICRAMLKSSPIILIDEATANIDEKTDKLVQKIIKTSFDDSTILIIAHRLSTLDDCTNILVLEGGQAVEWGFRKQLLKNPESRFRKMWQTHDKSYL